MQALLIRRHTPSLRATPLIEGINLTQAEVPSMKRVPDRAGVLGRYSPRRQGRGGHPGGGGTTSSTRAMSLRTRTTPTMRRSVLSATTGSVLKPCSRKVDAAMSALSVAARTVVP